MEFNNALQLFNQSQEALIEAKNRAAAAEVLARSAQHCAEIIREMHTNLALIAAGFTAHFGPLTRRRVARG